MMPNITNNRILQCASILLLSFLFCLSRPASAKDTDIYSINAKQNAYVLMDSSGSMNFGVYQHTIDYGAMFDYLFTLKDSPAGDYDDYIYDTVNNSNYFYNNHLPAKKIYLVKGKIGATIALVDGEEVAFSGDAADPDYLWYMNDLVDTHTVIDNDGNLTHDGSAFARRITVDTDGYILFDNKRLPLGLDIKSHDFKTLYDGTVVDNGFNGLLNAPGYYFSGYKSIAPLTQVANNDQYVYFFITGNWMNMQAMYNLHYKENPPGAADTGDAAWVYETFPLEADSWSQMAYSLDYPAGTGDYANNQSEINTQQTIVAAGAYKIQIRFSMFDVQGNGNTNTFTRDYVKIYDQSGNVIATYDNDNKPTSTNGGWSPIIPGNKAILKLYSNNNTTGQGYTIDAIRTVYEEGDSYLMQSRMDVAKDAMIYVVDEFRGKMNWGFAEFNRGNGANVRVPLNPTDNDDAQRASIISQINNVTASGGTPLMEALQDVWEDGFFKRNNVLNKLLCRKNYIISMTDGFPSVDDDNARIADVPAFGDFDNDKWTQDPYQGLGNKPDYYDDVAHWLYTHSWMDKSVVTDPANSYVNVITHHIAFGAKHPLLQDAAGESGGEYIVAYNKEQLIAAFYSLALMISDAISFTAPVVSVDAVNKIQSGDDLYMGLFLPQDNTYWAGNVKKFKIGDGSALRPELFKIYDAQNKLAINTKGEFLDNTSTFWGDDTDANDTDNFGAADIKEDGTGEVLLERMQKNFADKTYWERPIYTYKGGALVKFDRSNITAADLGVADDVTRDKLINFVHGYTYDASATDGAPTAVRDWVLGSIIHSRPVVVDYFDQTDIKLPLLKRYITVGANDGMLHVFDDKDGKEVLAFIPSDILPKLQQVQANNMYETVDGLITLYRSSVSGNARNPKYLIFGERRGGKYYWNLNVSDIDPLKWTVAWSYSNSEIVQSWSEVKIASIPINISAEGKKTFKDVAIFTGGYDPEEDFFPEPFTDQDSNGSPYTTSGNIDNTEWSKNTASQDVYDDDQYNAYNPSINEYGRGLFIVDIDNPTTIITTKLESGVYKPVLPFSITYDPTAVTTGNIRKSPDLKFSFPATPSVVTGTDKYYYEESGKTLMGIKDNVLLAIYFIDIYTNLFKAGYSFDIKNTSTTGTSWAVTDIDWAVSKLFSSNPGSEVGSGKIMPIETTTPDQGRKAFYPPAVSWGGSKGYFQAGNYFFPDVTFDTEDRMASLFFGTGDRENPKYTFIRNRFYSLYDDHSVTAEKMLTATTFEDVPVASTPYMENDLLNLTCDELGKDSKIISCYNGTSYGPCTVATADTNMKTNLRKLLTDDAVYGTTPALEYGSAHENDAKGWYIVLADQGEICSHMDYASTLSTTTNNSRDSHYGEQVLSQPVLYYGSLYFTSYQACTSDPCNPQGNGFSYALNYTDGTATYDLNDPDSDQYDITDRYKKFTGISGIPSGFAIITSRGKAAAWASVGGSVVGPRDGDKHDEPEINSPGLGLELFYWRDTNSQAP